MEAAYRQDGTLSGLRLRYYTDLGLLQWRLPRRGGHAHAPSGARGLPGRDVAWTTYGVYTNKVPVGPYRGYGQHATAYVIERVMDLIAHALHGPRRGETEEFHCSGCVSLSDSHLVGV